MAEIIETDLTFHGRKMIRVDGFFFVDSEMAVDLENTDDNRWLSEQKTNYIHEGLIYTRQDHTREGFEYFPRRRISDEEWNSMPRYVLNEDGTAIEEVLSA